MMDLDPLIAYLIVVYAISTVSLVYCNTFNYDQRWSLCYLLAFPFRTYRWWCWDVRLDCCLLFVATLVWEVACFWSQAAPAISTWSLAAPPAILIWNLAALPAILMWNLAAPTSSTHQLCVHSIFAVWYGHLKYCCCRQRRLVCHFRFQWSCSSEHGFLLLRWPRARSVCHGEVRCYCPYQSLICVRSLD